MIKVYVEGGAEGAGRHMLRIGFDSLFRSQKESLQKRQGRLEFVMCGSRGKAYDHFRSALKHQGAGTVALLVDAEARVMDTTPRGRVTHLKKRDGWTFASGHSENVHLMVECMEAWLVADQDALQAHFGKDFHVDSLPRQENLDEVDKSTLFAKLDRATRRTTKRSREGKLTLHDVGVLLQKIDPDQVGKRCSSFRMFRDWLEARIATANDSGDASPT